MELPNVGDIAWVEFDPAFGTEQAGRRPALVLTPRAYHQRSRRTIVCPITSNARPWPWNVNLPRGLKTGGVVLVDQIRTIERAQRMFGIIETAPAELVAEVFGKLISLLGINQIEIGGGADIR